MAEVAARDPSVGLNPAILHVDMDAFFASVEVLDDPSLKGKPVIVGGSGGRGVVAACTYEARAFGVSSAMPSVRARQLCPDAIFLSGRFGRYQEVSAQVAAVFRSVTPVVEPIGLDEAFLDVTGATRLLGSPREIARQVRSEVKSETGLICSVGIAQTKLIAKLASREAKPRLTTDGVKKGRGIVVIEPGRELEFLYPKPVRALWGVGPATAAKLTSLGVLTVGDLSTLDEDHLVRLFGKVHGAALFDMAHGIDRRAVEPDRAAKSVGQEETFGTDLHNLEETYAPLLAMSERVAAALRRKEIEGRTVTLKVRFSDFKTITRSQTLLAPINTAQAIMAVARHLIDGIEIHGGIRLLGVSMSGFEATDTGLQLAFSVDGTNTTDDRVQSAVDAQRIQESWTEVTGAIDAIREKFGAKAVGPARAATSTGLSDVTADREGKWGPGEEPNTP